MLWSKFASPSIIINSSITKLDKNFNIKENIIAEKINIKDKTWKLSNVITTDINNFSNKKESLEINSNFDLEKINIWNRSGLRAQKLQETLKAEGIKTRVVKDLPSAVADANLICTATMSREPLVLAEWISEGTHVDLVGSFTPNMRESDDALISTSQVFVDCRLTTEEQTGDLFFPIQNKNFSAKRIKGSLYDLCSGKVGREGKEAVTVFKNGGGGHIDLMVSRFLFEKFKKK